MTFIATGNNHNLAALLDRLRAASPTEHLITFEIVIPVVLGRRASWQGDHAAAVDLLEAIIPSLERLSRFPEHRTPLEDTLVEAQLRSGRFAAAETLLRERLAGQPRALPRDLFWLGRARHAAGRREGAAATIRTARDRWKDAEPDSPELIALDTLLAA